NSDDLLFREAAAFHVLVLSMGQNELQSGLDQRGKGTDDVALQNPVAVIGQHRMAHCHLKTRWYRSGHYIGVLNTAWRILTER
ncbi:hypothetical protein, partial [Mesorhizobium sp.]|uniref:hypothetical protein n=1 Tax=Mesorhizobium sp. TaxID=1871066 RepID=UPI0025C7006F